MLIATVGPRVLAAEKAVVDVLPVGRRDIRRLNAALLDGINQPEHTLHTRPTCQPQQDLAARAHTGHRRATFSRRAGAQDIDARDDGPEAVSLPADQREHRAGGEEDEAPTAIENLLTGITGEAQPEFDLIPIETPTRRSSEAPARSLLAFQAIPVWYSRHPFRALPEGGKDARTMEPSLSQCAFL